MSAPILSPRSPCDLQLPRGTGFLLAGFLRSADVEMASLALADRGHDPVSVHCCSDAELRRCIGLGPAQQGDTRWHWLLIEVDAADQVPIVREYLRACGAANVKYRKICSKVELRHAHAAVVEAACGVEPVLDEVGAAGTPIAEFHPLTWQAWTRGLTGARHD